MTRRTGGDGLRLACWRADQLGGTGHYVHWGFIQISVANLVVIGLMILVFVLAILLPFPRHGRRDK
jgi:hypothetical protein